jgi:hypothetical protein
MAGTTGAKSLKDNVNRMLDIVSLLGDQDWVKEARARLRKLDQRLEVLSLVSRPTLDPRLEVEFYSLIESHPSLRLASRVVFQAELVEIFEQGLSYYAELRKKRQLTSHELEQLRRGEDEHRRATEELDQLRQELLENEAE